ncbi:helix-turn-helix transcriptional regulator [Acidithiobacillus ferriphilus]|uniref:helix-turn-helix domain-containing protein n=1 Tax=Acidithiobacillus ferriphilus TaxID=1689834 RepID=UPI002DB722B6|nr:helix-turn-helix transcriptional regulator [Acidithiobacillus ferriphilus]MEB8534716.1 helix-turn-helix transcriptional regulator [Acidithiobacillus ferriphilus]
MNPPSSEIKIQSLFLRAIAHKGQRKTATEIGVHESALSRWFAGDGGLKFEQVCRLMAALEIQPEYLGDGEVTTIKADVLTALKRLAKAALDGDGL